MTNAQYRLERMERILDAFEQLHNAGELFYGNEAVTIEDAISVLENRIRITTIEVHEADNAQA